MHQKIAQRDHKEGPGVNLIRRRRHGSPDRKQCAPNVEILISLKSQSPHHHIPDRKVVKDFTPAAQLGGSLILSLFKSKTD